MRWCLKVTGRLQILARGLTRCQILEVSESATIFLPEVLPWHLRCRISGHYYCGKLKAVSSLAITFLCSNVRFGTTTKACNQPLGLATMPRNSVSSSPAPVSSNAATISSQSILQTPWHSATVRSSHRHRNVQKAQSSFRHGHQKVL